MPTRYSIRVAPRAVDGATVPCCPREHVEIAPPGVHQAWSSRPTHNHTCVPIEESAGALRRRSPHTHPRTAVHFYPLQNFETSVPCGCNERSGVPRSPILLEPLHKPELPCPGS